MTRLGAFFVRQPWRQLIPDLEDTLVTAGRGDDTRLISASRTPDRKLALLYIPADGKGPRTFTLNLSSFPGPVAVHWFNPAKDVPLIAHAVALSNQTQQILSTLGDNGTGVNDWVLILDTSESAFNKGSE